VSEYETAKQTEAVPLVTGGNAAAAAATAAAAAGMLAQIPIPKPSFKMNEPEAFRHQRHDWAEGGREGGSNLTSPQPPSLPHSLTHSLTHSLNQSPTRPRHLTIISRSTFSTSSAVHHQRPLRTAVQSAGRHINIIVNQSSCLQLFHTHRAGPPPHFPIHDHHHQHQHQHQHQNQNQNHASPLLCSPLVAFLE